MGRSARKLRILVKTTSGALPVLVAAGVTPFVACSPDPVDDSWNTGGAAGVTSTGGSNTGGVVTPAGGSNTGGVFAPTGGSNTGGALGTGGFIVIPPAPTGGTTSVERCYDGVDVFTVEFPPEGVPAEPGQICAASMEPVESFRAARVTLSAIPADLPTALGRIEIDARVVGDIVGLPEVEVVEATDSTLTRMVVTELVALADGNFSFLATWPDPIRFFAEYPSRMSVRTVLQMRCAPDSATTRRVHALTEIYQCMENAEERTPAWVSSGDSCIVCRIIAEMAPSPIVPDKQSDELPLARALRLRIVELARVSNTLVLLAENDGGDGLEYEWHPSGGRVERLAPDVVAWTLEVGSRSPIIQVAVMGPNAAAVASRGFYEAA